MHPHQLVARHAVFRHVNKSLRGLDLDFGQTADDVMLVCECSRAECTSRIRVTPAVYEKLRMDPQTFVILAGHEGAADEVVRRDDGFDLVTPSAPRAEERFLTQRADMRRQLAAELESLCAMASSPEEMPLSQLETCLEDTIRRYIGEEWLHGAETQASLKQIYQNYAGLETAEERVAALERLSTTLGAA